MRVRHVTTGISHGMRVRHVTTGISHGMCVRHVTTGISHGMCVRHMTTGITAAIYRLGSRGSRGNNCTLMANYSYTMHLQGEVCVRFKRTASTLLVLLSLLCVTSR